MEKLRPLLLFQLPITSCYDVIGEETIAYARFDRLLPSSYRIEIKG